MDILIALIVILVMWIGNAQARECSKEGRKNFAHMQATQKLRRAEDAKNKDYWCPDGEIYSIDYNFYSDGSLKKDVYTGIHYPKGEYYGNSMGFGPSHTKVGPSVKIPNK